MAQPSSKSLHGRSGWSVSRLRALAAHVLRVSILSKAFPDLHAGLREEIAQLVAHAEDAVSKEEAEAEKAFGFSHGGGE